MGYVFKIYVTSNQGKEMYGHKLIHGKGDPSLPITLLVVETVGQ